MASCEPRRYVSPYSAEYEDTWLLQQAYRRSNTSPPVAVVRDVVKDNGMLFQLRRHKAKRRAEHKQHHTHHVNRERRTHFVNRDRPSTATRSSRLSRGRLLFPQTKRYVLGEAGVTEQSHFPASLGRTHRTKKRPRSAVSSRYRDNDETVRAINVGSLQRHHVPRSEDLSDLFSLLSPYGESKEQLGNVYDEAEPHHNQHTTYRHHGYSRHSCSPNSASPEAIRIAESRLVQRHRDEVRRMRRAAAVSLLQRAVRKWLGTLPVTAAAKRRTLLAQYAIEEAASRAADARSSAVLPTTIEEAKVISPPNVDLERSVTTLSTIAATNSTTANTPESINDGLSPSVARSLTSAPRSASPTSSQMVRRLELMIESQRMRHQRELDMLTKKYQALNVSHDALKRRVEDERRLGAEWKTQVEALEAEKLVTSAHFEREQQRLQVEHNKALQAAERRNTDLIAAKYSELCLVRRELDRECANVESLLAQLESAKAESAMHQGDAARADAEAKRAVSALRNALATKRHETSRTERAMAGRVRELSNVASARGETAADTSATEALASPSEFSSAWTRVWDSAAGQWYFYKESTGEVQWEMPDGESYQTIQRFGSKHSLLSVAIRVQNVFRQKIARLELRQRRANLVVEADEHPSYTPWKMIFDPATSCYYYFHIETQEVSWERPTAMDNEDCCDGGGGWVQLFDPRSESDYFYHELTGETSWDRPIDFVENVLGSKLGTQWNKFSVLLRSVLRLQSSWRARTARKKLRRIRGISVSKNQTNDECSWVTVNDPKSGQPYYFHPATNEMQWELPFGAVLASNLNETHLINSKRPPSFVECSGCGVREANGRYEIMNHDTIVERDPESPFDYAKDDPNCTHTYLLQRIEACAPSGGETWMRWVLARVSFPDVSLNLNTEESPMPDQECVFYNDNAINELLPPADGWQCTELFSNAALPKISHSYNKIGDENVDSKSSAHSPARSSSHSVINAALVSKDMSVSAKTEAVNSTLSMPGAITSDAESLEADPFETMLQGMELSGSGATPATSAANSRSGTPAPSPKPRKGPSFVHFPTTQSVEHNAAENSVLSLSVTSPSGSVGSKPSTPSLLERRKSKANLKMSLSIDPVDYGDMPERDIPVAKPSPGAAEAVQNAVARTQLQQKQAEEQQQDAKEQFQVPAQYDDRALWSVLNARATPSGRKVGQWEERVDAHSGEIYYHNRQTMESRWDPPKDFERRAGHRNSSSSAAHGNAAAPAPSGFQQGSTSSWEQLATPKGQRLYWYNWDTGDSSWESPQGVPISGANGMGGVLPSVKEEEIENLDENNDGSSVHLPRVKRLWQVMQNHSRLEQVSGCGSWEMWTEPRSMQVYYVNTTTGISQWETPEAPEEAPPLEWVLASSQTAETNSTPSIDYSEAQPSPTTKTFGVLATSAQAAVRLKRKGRARIASRNWSCVVGPGPPVGNGRCLFEFNWSTGEVRKSLNFSSAQVKAHRRLELQKTLTEKGEQAVAGEVHLWRILHDRSVSTGKVAEQDIGTLGTASAGAEAAKKAGAAIFTWGEMLDERSGEVFYVRSALDRNRGLMRQDWQWERPVALGGSGRGSRGTNVIANGNGSPMRVETATSVSGNVANPPTRLHTPGSPWKKIQSLEGDTAYWYNRNTGESQWHDPAGGSPIKRPSSLRYSRSGSDAGTAAMAVGATGNSSFRVGSNGGGFASVMSPKGKKLFEFSPKHGGRWKLSD